MTPDRMRQCMSLGYSTKSKSANTIGQCTYCWLKFEVFRIASFPLRGETFMKFSEIKTKIMIICIQ